MNRPLVRSFTDLNCDAEVFGAELPVLVEFGTTWCPPCRAMEPHVAAIAEAYAGRLSVGATDIDDNHAFSMRLRVQAAPTFVLVHKGEVVDRIVGAVPRARLDAMVRRVVAPA